MSTAESAAAGRQASPPALPRLPRRIGWLPFEQARLRPDAPAVGEGATVWTYGRLADAVRATAARLTGVGVRPGDRLAIVCENGIAAAVLIFAASELDAWPVILNARLSAPELDAILEHCRPRRVAYAALSPDALAHARRHGAAAMNDADVPGGWMGALAAGVETERLETSAARQVGALIYTSGTTGKPKGVMLSHRNVLYSARISASVREMTAADRIYAALPVSHSFGLSSVLLGGTMAGAYLAFAPRFSPQELARALAEDGITVFQGVPTMFARLLDWYAATGTRPLAPRLRFASSGGGPLEPGLKRRVEAALGVRLNNGYGLSEAAPVVALTRSADPNEGCSIGFAADGVEVRLVDEAGAPVAPGAIGELHARGPNVMLGYYRDPALTAAAITADGWLRTGDLARAEPDGRLHVVGRKKEMIIHGGFNVYPEELEALFHEHPKVALAGVVGVPNGVEEDVVLYVQPRSGAAVDPAELAAFAAARLVGYKRPSRIVVMDPLPVTLSGKVQKGRLRALAIQGS